MAAATEVNALGRSQGAPVCAAAPVAAVAFGWALTIVLAGCALLLGVSGGALLLTGADRALGGGQPSPSPLALRDIPPAYLDLYEQAAERYGLDWTILAGIGRVECDHGRDPDPSCTREGAENHAGAGGPMQFLASTWARYGVSAGGGTPDRWRASDAILSAANYLRASGAPADYRAAIYAYNHSYAYVAEVLRWAAAYRGAPATSAPTGPLAPLAVAYTPGTRARLLPSDGHVALAPAQAPPVVAALIAAGNELQDEPYGPAGHPDPRGAPSQDCSSSVSYVLWRAGLRPIAEIVRDNPLASSYMGWGAPGPGRWVTIYASAGHVFIVIAHLRLDTSHSGTDVGPNRLQDGPRWRIFPRIPTWAQWTVRHPPGL